MLFCKRVLCLFLFTLFLSQCANVKNLNEGIADFRAQNYRNAFIHLKPEAEKGQPAAQYAIGYMYYYGRGVVEDRRKALVWISRAASAGHLEAIQALEILTHTPTTRSLSSFTPISPQSPQNEL